MRWTIVYGKYDGVEKYALDVLYNVVQPHVPYILTVNSANISIRDLSCYNIIFLGTVNSNRYIRDFADKGIIVPNIKKEGYTTKVFESILNSERQMIVLAGADENGTLYAVDDFEHYYVDANVDDIYEKKKVFTEKIPDIFLVLG